MSINKQLNYIKFHSHWLKNDTYYQTIICINWQWPFTFQALISRCRELSDVELERYFNFAAVWAFGGTLEAECRESFSNWWKEQFEQHIDYPEEGTVRFSCFSLWQCFLLTRTCCKGGSCFLKMMWKYQYHFFC